MEDDRAWVPDSGRTAAGGGVRSPAKVCCNSASGLEGDGPPDGAGDVVPSSIMLNANSMLSSCNQKCSCK